MITARSLRGEYSEVRLIKLGMAPPRPRPARNRKASSTPKLGANAVAMVKMPKQPVAPISTALRPIRSASNPKPKAPKARPAKAALNTMRSDGSGMCRSAAMPAAASPMDCRSRPSSKATSMHKTTMRICRAPSGRVSIKSETLNGVPAAMLGIPPRTFGPTIKHSSRLTSTRFSMCFGASQRLLHAGADRRFIVVS